MVLVSAFENYEKMSGGWWVIKKANFSPLSNNMSLNLSTFLQSRDEIETRKSSQTARNFSYPYSRNVSYTSNLHKTYFLNLITCHESLHVF